LINEPTKTNCRLLPASSSQLPITEKNSHLRATKNFKLNVLFFFEKNAKKDNKTGIAMGQIIKR